MSKKNRPKVKLKKVVLTPVSVLQVKVPPGIVPVVVADPERRVVEIAPVVKAKAKKSWWAEIFGPAS